MKEKKCGDLGIESRIINLNENITTNELILEVEKLNNDRSSWNFDSIAFTRSH